MDFDNFPSISYPDIVNYLVFRPGPYSADDMKAYKSLETYNQVIKGWVRDVKVNLNKNGLTAVNGKVGWSTAQLFVAFALKQLRNHYTVFNIFIIYFLAFAFTKTE